ncbi:TIGR03085 family metal-binding protein [Cellulomonas oligotrophica]|nr:TIGR03085 family metal-binding protein [Cellulomonas oligotrophica]NYD84886.1 uncharacterized protein (TIGR03085 family) [Cellulomonas oligotrophica]
MTWHATERARLAEALTAAGPDAPTLCAGWRSRHLAAHLVVREQAPSLGAGVVVPVLTGRLDEAIDTLAADAQDADGYAALVERFATPPPRWSPVSWAGELINVTEYFVHGEDVRRGAGPVGARPVPDELRDRLWSQLVAVAPLRLARLGVGVVLVRPDGVRRRVRSPRAGHGAVVLRGEVGELVLAVSGRLQAAHVQVEGDEADVARVREALSGP